MYFDPPEGRAVPKGAWPNSRNGSGDNQFLQGGILKGEVEYRGEIGGGYLLDRRILETVPAERLYTEKVYLSKIRRPREGPWICHFCRWLYRIVWWSRLFRRIAYKQGFGLVVQDAVNDLIVSIG